MCIPLRTIPVLAEDAVAAIDADLAVAIVGDDPLFVVRVDVIVVDDDGDTVLDTVYKYIYI
jgi:hypothetical protein